MIRFFQDIREVSAFLSERKDGSMKLVKDSDVNQKNRKRFFKEIGIGGEKVVAAEIVHGTKIEMVDEGSPDIILGADGMVTRKKDIFLSVTVADCIPVFFYEKQQEIVGIAHCGWRGIVDGIIGNAVGKIAEIGGNPENIRVVLGPGIGKCHFEIREDVLDNFRDHPESVANREERIFVDLKGIIKKQLFLSGARPENIEDDDECTMESRRYFSYRRDKPEIPEAMVAVIGMV